LNSSYNQCDGCDEEDDVGTPGTFQRKMIVIAFLRTY
jgi:hypothetical protein